MSNLDNIFTIKAVINCKNLEYNKGFIALEYLNTYYINIYINLLPEWNLEYLSTYYIWHITINSDRFHTLQHYFSLSTDKDIYYHNVPICWLYSAYIGKHIIVSQVLLFF